MSEMPEIMIVTCPSCGGDGGHEGQPSKWSLDGSGPWHRCETCDGEGVIEDEIVTRTLEDIESEDDGEGTDAFE